MSVPWWYAVILAAAGLLVGLIAGNEWRLGGRGRGRALDVDLVGVKPGADVVVLDWSEQPRLRFVPPTDATAEQKAGLVALERWARRETTRRVRERQQAAELLRIARDVAGDDGPKGAA